MWKKEMGITEIYLGTYIVGTVHAQNALILILLHISLTSKDFTTL